MLGNLLHKSKDHRGFTLSEVLIVVTIIVIIALAILLGINPLLQIFKGYDARRKADLHKLKVAFEAYYADHDCYPSTDILQQCGSNALEPYLKSIPCDPQDNKPYTLKLIPADSMCPQKFAIYGTLLSPTDSLAGSIPGCPETMAVSSPNMPYLQIIEGCSGIITCNTLYGCRSGQCVIVGQDDLPSCAPNYCDSDCGGVDCGKVARGNLINECVPF
jgi:prepilin-type N-terminal cleavage/methylation domain-containing protein